MLQNAANQERKNEALNTVLIDAEFKTNENPYLVCTLIFVDPISQAKE